MISRLGAVGLFFALRIICALLLLKLAASRLSVGGFADFSQYLAFASLVTLLAVGGVQNGLIRQVAAARERSELVGALTASAAIWIVASAVLLVAALAGSDFIGTVLVGHQGESALIIGLTSIAVLAGPGQLRCSALTGRGALLASLTIQGAGLIVGSAGAAYFTVQGRPAAAAVAFACGSLIPSIPVVTLLFRPRSKPPAGALFGHVRQLLRFAAAFGAVSAAAPLTLFALRWQYRTEFGQVALGQWLSANRISDLSTQLIGLFMVQIYVPRMAQIGDSGERRRFMLACGFSGMAIMAMPLIAFTLAAAPLVRLFLSPSFLPAIPAIETYMAGDMFRIWTSMAIYTAFASGKAERYAALELAAVGSIALLTMVAIRHGYSSAPQWAYLATHAGFFAVVFGLLFARSRSATVARIADTACSTLKTSARQL